MFVPFDPVADYDAYVDGKPPRRRDAILPEGTVNLSNPRAIFAGSPPRFTRSRVTYEAYVVSRTSTRPQVDSAIPRAARTSLSSSAEASVIGEPSVRRW